MAKQSRWVQHLKNYSKQKNISYLEAMKSADARKQYHQQKGGNCSANVQQGGNCTLNGGRRRRTRAKKSRRSKRS